MLLKVKNAEPTDEGNCAKPNPFFNNKKQKRKVSKSHEKKDS
jgi:hypothetical protein